jgi:hypothetical protein
MSQSPGQPPPPFGIPPEQYPRPPRNGRWPRRHPVWSAVIVAAALLAGVAAAAQPQAAPASHHAAAAAGDPAASATVAPAAHRAALTCHARAIRRRPRVRSTVRIRVRTAARAWVSAATHAAVADPAPGRASKRGTRILRVRVGSAPPGVRVVFAVRVSRHGRTGTCRAAFRPRRVRVRAAPAPTKAPTTAPAPPPPPPTSAPPTPAGCYPKTDSGNCYEPGEFCRDSDHGIRGVAGDGEKIVCTDNNGWRWEPL